MQLYFPNFKTKQAAIGMFDYLMACKDSDEHNVIFNSDLYLDDLVHLSGRTAFPDKDLNTELFYNFFGFMCTNWTSSTAQVFQDMYALWRLQNKTNGSFVEIGTAYPTWGNNTYMLENKLRWSGVCVEPNPMFTKLIQQDRTSPLEVKAIFTKSDADLVLSVPNDFGPGGGIVQDEQFSYKDPQNTPDTISNIEVKTLSIIDCLHKHNIGKDFDYLSYDTTGHADDISTIELMLKENYLPKVITIAHNYKNHRQNLNSMLQLYGYVREFDYVSRWDDWYYLKEQI